jgi:hypothetical protein
MSRRAASRRAPHRAIAPIRYIEHIGRMWRIGRHRPIPRAVAIVESQTGGGDMTETEWLACEDLDRMLEFLHGRVSDRKLRLFACACCRRLWPFIHDEKWRWAIEIVERHLDGEATEEELRGIEGTISYDRDELEDAAIAFTSAITPFDMPGGIPGMPDRPPPSAVECASNAALYAARAVRMSSIPDRMLRLEYGWSPEVEKQFDAVLNQELKQQPNLLRCIIGNPFRPARPGPWITPAAVSVAHDIYERRDFSALPVLADLLEEAGCPEQSVLDHCRRPGEHARGCWVVDLILGKE